MRPRAGAAQENDECCAVRAEFTGENAQFPNNQFNNNDFGCDNGPDSRDLKCIIQVPYPDDETANGRCIPMDSNDMEEYLRVYPVANN